MGSAAKRQLTQELIEEHHIAVSRACKILSLNRSQFYYTTQRDDSETIEALQELAFKPHRLSESDLWFSEAFCLSEKVGQTMESQKGLPRLQAIAIEQKTERQTQTSGQNQTTLTTTDRHKPELEWISRKSWGAAKKVVVLH